MKTRSTFYSLVLMLAFGIGSTATAQNDAESLSYTPKHMWEAGLSLGGAVNVGDYDLAPGFGAGVHLRRAIDHIFSVRVDGQFLTMNSKAPSKVSQYTFQDFNTTLVGGAAHVVASINTFRFDNTHRKVNLYAFGGPGANYIVAMKGDDISGKEIDLIETKKLSKIMASAEAGAGAALRISPKFNVGLEWKALVPFGKAADFLDGFNNEPNVGTTYRDIAHYFNVRLNFNLGNANEKSEPLYWVNPLNMVIDDLTELKARPKLDLTDTDKDGIIDMLDEEKDTPENAPVDTRGIALDSDNDGVKDFEDAEPYSPAGATVDARGLSQKPDYLTRPQVDDLIAAKLRDYQLSEKSKAPTSAMEDWFLPMIHFDLDSYSVRSADYGHMKNVATVMKKNPSVRVLVVGYTDKLASASYNRVLSYNRARAAKEYLVNRYGISADRLIINYDGQENTLVPTQTGNFMNRRVEFRVAKSGDTDMGQPEGPRAGKGTFFSGSRDAGY